MTATADTATAADEVLEIIADLCAAADARSKVPPVLLVLTFIFARLTRLRDGFSRLVARIRAGKKRRPYAPRPLIGGAAPRIRKPVQWPTKYRAIGDLLGDDAAQAADRLRAWLATAEAVAFIVANPDAGRYLRPLCRDLGVRLIPELRRRRSSRPVVEPMGEPVAEPVVEPVVERVAEPIAEPAASLAAPLPPASPQPVHHHFVEASAMPFTPTHLTRKPHWAW